MRISFSNIGSGGPLPSNVITTDNLEPNLEASRPIQDLEQFKANTKDVYTKAQVDSINSLANYYTITDTDEQWAQFYRGLDSKQPMLTAGKNIAITQDVISADTYSKDEIDEGNRVISAALNELNTTKQPMLTAGENITIDENNVISSTGGGTDTYEDVTIHHMLHLMRPGAKGEGDEAGGWISSATGTGDDYYTNHAWRLGGNYRDHMDFYEYGADYRFYKSVGTSKTLLLNILENEMTFKGDQVPVIKKLTQAQYDALTSKKANMLYIITD